MWSCAIGLFVGCETGNGGGSNNFASDMIITEFGSVGETFLAVDCGFGLAASHDPGHLT